MPDADWIKSRISITTNPIRTIKSKTQIEDVIRFKELQKHPLKTKNIELIWEASKLLPELNLIIYDQSGDYSEHSIYFPLSPKTYNKIRNKEIEEHQLKSRELKDTRLSCFLLS